MHHLFVLVDHLHELDDPALVVEPLLPAVPQVLEKDGRVLVEERQVAQPAHQYLIVEAGVREDLRVGLEGDGCAGAFRLADDLQGDDDVAPLEADVEILALVPDPHVQPCGKAVHDRQTDPMQTAGDLVALPVELASGVKGGHHHLHGGLVVLRHDAGRDPSTVIGDGRRPIRVYRDLDPGAEPAHGLVDAVVDDLVHQMVQAAGVGAPDVHARPLADRLQAFEHLDALGVVTGIFHRISSCVCFLSDSNQGSILPFSRYRATSVPSLALPSDMAWGY